MTRYTPNGPERFTEEGYKIKKEIEELYANQTWTTKAEGDALAKKINRRVTKLQKHRLEE